MTAAGEPLPPFAAAAAAYPERLPPAERKRRGAWFTPRSLAQPTAQRTLAPLLRRDRPLRIVDPAVGGGTFLLAALEVLVAAGLPAPHAASWLCGRDLDATAARLAADAVAEASGAAADTLDLRQGDGLLDLEPGSFDAVLTNPPWETLQAGPDAASRTRTLRPHFSHQGHGKLQTYRLFVERAFTLLRPGGRLGLIVPASLWFDRDAEPLRRLLLDHTDWQWLFGFENRDKVFPIDSRYRFAVIVAEKGGRTRAVQVAFGRTDVAEWAAAAPPHVRYERDELRRCSPLSGTFVEVTHRRDLDLLARLHERGTPLLGPHGAFEWRQGDFNMTADRGCFVERAHAEHDGYAPDADGVWRRAGAIDLLPLYQGAMIDDLQPNAAAHAAGHGHGTRWQKPRPDRLQPLYLVPASTFAATTTAAGPRLALRALSNATNARTAIACLLPPVPCGNSLGVLTNRAPTTTPLRQLAAGTAALSSLAFDWALRIRLGGTNLNRFVLMDCVLPALDEATTDELARLALAMCAVLPWHGTLWQLAQQEGWCGDASPALDAATRALLTTRIDVLVGRAFGLTRADVAWMVRGCELPAERLVRHRPAPELAKGFWRVDRTLPPAARRPNRWLAALG